MTDLSAHRDQLTSGLQQLGVPDFERLVEPLLHYLAELAKWNKAYNLTAVRDPAEMVTRHILDSYSVFPYICGPRVIDVGTGAGLPGIPLALANSEHEYVLLDANGKKVRFLQHIIGELGLSNVSLVQSRVDEHTDGGWFDTVVCRAFTSIAEFVANSGHLAAPEGRLVAMKGKLPATELAELQADWAVSATEILRVPGLDAERHVVVLRRS
jgi:16S rRNA (guanine527-N7)-methyltransferase